MNRKYQMFKELIFLNTQNQSNEKSESTAVNLENLNETYGPPPPKNMFFFLFLQLDV